MSVQEIAQAVMELSEADRLELARQIVASVVSDRESADEIEGAVKGIEDVLTGKVRGLSEAEFRRARSDEGFREHLISKHPGACTVPSPSPLPCPSGRGQG